jgi:DNA helicase-2/ATP-dependent DNA helicase PcrA
MRFNRGCSSTATARPAGSTASKDINGVALRRYVDTPHYISALSILRESDRDEANLNGCSVVTGLDAYRELLDSRSYLDYSSILETAVEVLTTDDGLRERLAQRVKYVIVDEYQDVNPVQEAIVWCLHDLGARICVVGDDDQTIYQWRGSDVDNILTFDKRYPGVDRVSIEENFRSSDGIVLTARPFIEQNTARLPKAMKPTGVQPYSIRTSGNCTWPSCSGSSCSMAQRWISSGVRSGLPSLSDLPRLRSCRNCWYSRFSS